MRKAKRFTKREKALAGMVIILALALIGVFVWKGDLSWLSENPGQNNDGQKISVSFYSAKTDIELPRQFDEESLLEIHFIDVGQGDAILVRLPDGKDMLIDAGSGTTASNAVKNKFETYLEDMDIDTLDYLIITHPDSDHVNMAQIALDNYEVKNIYYNDIYSTASNTYKEFVDLSKVEDGAQLFSIDEDGEYYQIASEEWNYQIDIIAPGHSRFSDRNSMSVFCLLKYGGTEVLFTGDAHTDSEEYLMEYLDQGVDIDILKVGHHGSDSSTSMEFLEFFDPEYAVISVAQTNAYNHPSPFLMNRLFEYGVVTYRTNRHGDIVLYMDNQENFGFLCGKNVAVENNSKEINEKRLVLEK